MFSLRQIMSSIRQILDAKTCSILSGIIALYLVTRLTHLTALPIFSDEGIYIHWAKMAAYDQTWRFISLLDGKQPLQTWLTIPWIRLMPADLLTAGRLASVVTGVAGLIGMIALSGYLWGRRAAYVGGILYVANPYFVFYDRIALIDSGVNAAYIWILLLSLLMARHRRLDLSLIGGVIMGIGLLAKSSVGLFVGLSALSPLTVMHISGYRSALRDIWHHVRTHLPRLADHYALYLISCMIALALYMMQWFFSPWFHNIGQKNLTFILSLHEWLEDPLQLVRTTWYLVIEYVSWESGFVIAILGIMGLAYILRRDRGLGIYLWLWLLIPYILIINFNRVLYPRYVIFFSSLLTLGTIYLITHLRSRYLPTVWMRVLLVCICLSYFVYPMIYDIPRISMPEIDRGQYVRGSTAVWGASELMDLVRRETRPGRYSLVLAEGNFGLIADVLDILVRPDDHIEIRGRWPLREEDIREAQSETGVKDVFVVFSHRSEIPVHWDIELLDLLATYDKPDGSPDKVYLYRVVDGRK